MGYTMKIIQKSCLISLLALFSLSAIANTQVPVDPKKMQNEKNAAEMIDPENTDNFDCTLECHRKCEKNDKAAGDCSNNKCSCVEG